MHYLFIGHQKVHYNYTQCRIKYIFYPGPNIKLAPFHNSTPCIMFILNYMNQLLSKKKKF